MLRPASPALVLMIGGVFAFGPIATDMFVVAMPSLAEAFGTDPLVIQGTMSFYLVFFALGQLFWGPVSDRFGRRPAMLAGIAVFALGSLLSALSDGVQLFTMARCLQAFGVAYGQVLGRAVMRDLHSPQDTTRMIAFGTAIMGMTSMTSPLLGGYLLLWSGWHAIFAFHVGYSLFILLMVLLVMQETVPHKNAHAVRPVQTLRNFRTLLQSRLFVGYTLVLCCMFGFLFSMLSGSPFVFMKHLGMKMENFGFVFTCSGGAFITASFLTGAIGRRVAPSRLLLVAITWASLSGAGGLVTAWLGGGIVPLIVALTSVSWAMGFILPLTFSGALAPNPHMAGTASSLFGFVQGCFSAAMAYLVGVIDNGTAVPMMAQIAVLTTGALLTCLFIIRPAQKRIAAPA